MFSLIVRRLKVVKEHTIDNRNWTISYFSLWSCKFPWDIYIHYAYIDLEDFACLGIGSLKYFLDANFGVVVWWHTQTMWTIFQSFYHIRLYIPIYIQTLQNYAIVKVFMYLQIRWLVKIGFSNGTHQWCPFAFHFQNNFNFTLLSLWNQQIQFLKSC